MPIQIGTAAWDRMLSDGAAALGVRLDAGQVRLLSVHAGELLKWNRRVNLTRITEPVEVAVKHFLDSLAAVPLIRPGVNVLDIGSGGGFPGLPIKVALPDAEVTLVDSVRKKVSFLKHVIREIGLQGIGALQSRIEDLGDHPAHHRKYEVVISRALSRLDVFERQGRPFLSQSGIMIALKGGRAAEEINILEAQYKRNHMQGKGHIAEVKNVVLPVLNLERQIVVLT